jgi:hypothetical protein
MSEMPIDVAQEQMWTLSADLRAVRLSLPPLPLVGLPEPLKVHMEFDAMTVDEILQRLTLLRASMLPPPVRQ